MRDNITDPWEIHVQYKTMFSEWYWTVGHLYRKRLNQKPTRFWNPKSIPNR